MKEQTWEQNKCGNTSKGPLSQMWDDYTVHMYITALKKWKLTQVKVKKKKKELEPPNSSTTSEFLSDYKQKPTESQFLGVGSSHRASVKLSKGFQSAAKVENAKVYALNLEHKKTIKRWSPQLQVFQTANNSYLKYK